MNVLPLVKGKYVYIHDGHEGSFQEIDAHHILVQTGSVRGPSLYLAICILLAHICYLLLIKEKPGVLFLWNILMGIFVVKALHRKSIKKESVMIMPGFGVQLEKHFGSGRVVRRFVPIGKILKPVLNECVTPVTCYWSLALIVREEAELMLVFQKLRPPVKMLVPVWKALRAATDCEESKDTVVEDDQLQLHDFGSTAVI